MVKTAIIKIWGEVVGAVAWDEDRQVGSFEYDPGFIGRGWDLAPLKMPISELRRIYTFPELRKPQDSEYDTFKGLPGLLADTLPGYSGDVDPPVPGILTPPDWGLVLAFYSLTILLFFSKTVSF